MSRSRCELCGTHYARYDCSLCKREVCSDCFRTQLGICAKCGR